MRRLDSTNSAWQCRGISTPGERKEGRIMLIYPYSAREPFCFRHTYRNQPPAIKGTLCIETGIRTYKLARNPCHTARFDMGHPTASKIAENRMSPTLEWSRGRETRDEKSIQALPIESFDPLRPYEHVVLLCM